MQKSNKQKQTKKTLKLHKKYKYEKCGDGIINRSDKKIKPDKTQTHKTKEMTISLELSDRKDNLSMLRKRSFLVSKRNSWRKNSDLG